MTDTVDNDQLLEAAIMVQRGVKLWDLDNKEPTETITKSRTFPRSGKVVIAFGDREYEFSPDDARALVIHISATIEEAES